GVAYFVQSGDSRVIASVLPFALGSQAIAAIILFAGLVLCLVGAPGKIRFQLLLVGAIIGDVISILLGVVVVLGVIQHPAILFLGAAFGLLGWGSLLTFFHGLALELGSRETANHCVLLTIATVVWMATSFVLLFSVPLAFILLVGI